MVTTIKKFKKTDCSPGAAVFGVSGSPRKGGNSDILLREILKGVEAVSVAAASVNLTKVQFQGCIGCERCRRDGACTGLTDGMTVLYDRVAEARGMVLVSPTHNYNITSWMKAFIDRLYCFYTFGEDRPRSWTSRLAGQSRKAVLAAICEQEHERDMGVTLEAMREPLLALGYDILGELAVYRIFDKGKVGQDEEALARAGELGRRLGRAVG